MVRSLLIHGMLAGAIAGILGFLFAFTVGEGPVETAIGYEAYVESIAPHDSPGAHDGHEHDEDEVVGRPLQRTAGLVTGTLIYGVALGGIFALVFAATYGRLGPLAARGTAAVLGGLGFIAVYLAPFLKYPANPPAVGDPDTIQYRTFLYVILVVVSIVAMVLASMLRQRLVEGFGGWNASLIAGGVYLAILMVCYLVLPTINEVPQQALPGLLDAVGDTDVTFPPAVLWAFRVSSIGLHLTIWSTIALVFGALAQRHLDQPTPLVRAEA